MRHQIFWLFTAAVLALACHVGYMLFIPSRTFSAAIDSAMGDSPLNQFTVLSPDAQMQLVPFAAAEHLVGLCKFDVSKGHVKVAANLPKGFWSFAVYTIRGRQVYHINDTQSEGNTFTVEMSRDEGLLAAVLGSGEDSNEFVSNDIGWRIAVTENQGIAVLWMPVADPLLRKDAEEVVKKSRCFRVDG
jgi:uncharacterized membrane protein